MLRAVGLFLPVLFPSWRFFAWIAPSPRIEVAILPDWRAVPAHWKEFRPRPKRVSPISMVRRLFWNPDWNESLFLLSCAERVVESEEAKTAERKIADRVRAELIERHGGKPKRIGEAYCFRLIAYSRTGPGEEVIGEEVFRSSAYWMEEAQ